VNDRGVYGTYFWLRFAEWCRQRPDLLAKKPADAAQLIGDEFSVSRATAYRWLRGVRDFYSTKAEY